MALERCLKGTGKMFEMALERCLKWHRRDGCMLSWTSNIDSKRFMSEGNDNQHRKGDAELGHFWCRPAQQARFPR